MAGIPYDERLERLLVTAAGVFATKGYHPTTMRDLARATGMSLAGMYHYVSGKDELLYLVQERTFTQVLAGAEAAVSSGTTPSDRLARFIRHHVTFFARHKSETKVLSHEADSLSEARVEGVNSLKRRYVELLLSVIREFNRNGRDPRVAAYALFGMMNWIYNWYDPNGPIPPEALAEQFTQLFLNGLTAPLPASAPTGG